MVKEHTCDKCEARFKSWHYKDGHERQEHPELFPYECPSCDKNLKTERGVRTHHKQSHDESLVDEEVECDTCGEPFVQSGYKLRRNEHHFCSSECYADFRSQYYIGDKHHNWKGGRQYYGENWYAVRREVRSRDEVCQKCGSDGSDCLLDVHHIDPIRTFEKPEEANTMDNLILLCRSCHRAVEENQAKCPQPEAW